MFVIFTCEFLSNAQDCLLIATAAPIHVVLCFKMHRFGPEMQSKRLSTRRVMLNPIGPSIPLQVRVLASPNIFTEPNHFEEELLKENGLPGDLLKDMTKTRCYLMVEEGQLECLQLITFSSKN